MSKSIRSRRLLGLPVDRRRRNRSGNWMSALDPFYPSARIRTELLQIVGEAEAVQHPLVLCLREET